MPDQTERRHTSPDWRYWGTGMPDHLSHVTEEMAKAARDTREAVMSNCPPSYAADVGEHAYYIELSERAGIAAALAVFLRERSGDLTAADQPLEASDE